MPLQVGTFTQPGQYNTYVPNHEATGKLRIAFSRNPKDFALPNYVQYRDVSQSTGLFLRIKSEEAGRILDADLKEYVWPDGADRPTGEFLEDFRYEQYRCFRYDFPMRIGDIAKNEADWNVQEMMQAFNAQKAMTGRTVRCLAQLATESNWDANHWSYISSMDVDGYDWESSTTTDESILKSIQKAVQTIEKDTFGVVKFKDLQLVASPATWSKIATAQELRDYVKQQVSSPQIIEGSKWGLEMWGMPDRLYGIPLVSENCVRLTTQRGASTQTRNYAMAEGDVFLLARPGSIEGTAGGPSFSTVTALFREESTVEVLQDPNNRRTRWDVVDNYDIVMTAPVSGFWFRGVTSDTSSSS